MPGAPQRRATINATAAQTTATVAYSKPVAPAIQPFVALPALAPSKVPTFGSWARLQTLSSNLNSVIGSAQEQGSQGQVTIFIPHLPEELELGRENTFTTTNSPITPDGFSIYESTSPLEIPFEFTLHAYDDVVEEGAYTLLEMAAKLHAIGLPASNDPTPNTVTPPANASPDSAPSSDLSNANPFLNQPSPGSNGFVAPKTYKYPPACSLRILQTGPKGYGIHCVGFIKGFRFKLHGPYMSGAPGSEIYNLPTAITYSFTFVHNPAYTNLIRGKNIQAFGPDILAYLYNTRHLADLADNSYAEIDSLDASRQIQ